MITFSLGAPASRLAAIRHAAALEFFLNEGQAIRIAMLADTVETANVCETVIKAYLEHRCSQISNPAQTADLAPVLVILHQMAETLDFLTKHMVSR